MISDELKAYRVARENHLAALESYDDDRLDLLSEAREIAIRVSGKPASAMPRVPIRAAGESMSLSLLMDIDDQICKAVPESRREEYRQAVAPCRLAMSALATALYDLTRDCSTAAALIQDVLVGDSSDTCWRIVEQRTGENARASTVYQVDELLALGYSAIVVHRYRGDRRGDSAHTFETWVWCTEEGSRVARWQRLIGHYATGMWHQLLVPHVDIKDDAEPEPLVLRLKVDQCIERRARVNSPRV
jgi:hypothetical protein